MRRRTAVAVVGTVTTAALLAASAATTVPAGGVTAGQGSAHAQSIYVNGTNALSVNVTSTGNLSTSGLTTLATNLTQLPLSLTGALGSAVTALTGTQADSPATNQTRPPAGSFPASCSSLGWTSSDCFNTLPLNVNVPGVASVAVGAARGYATADSAGYVASAATTTTDLSLLGGLLDVGNLGVATSLAQCGATTSAACSATQSLTGTSLLNGLVTAQVAQSGSTSVLTAKVLQNGTPVNVGAVDVPVGSTGTTVSVNNNLLTIKLALTINQLLGLFGNGLVGLVAMTLSSLLSGITSTLSAVLGSLLGGVALDTTRTKIGLTVTLGPGQSVTNGVSASSWALDVKAALSSTVVFNVTGLLGSSLGTLTAATTGTVLDLELGYSSATPGPPVATWIPPGAI